MSLEPPRDDRTRQAAGLLRYGLDCVGRIFCEQGRGRSPSGTMAIKPAEGLMQINDNTPGDQVS